MAFVEGESITNILKLHILLGGGMGDKGEVVGPNAERLRAFYYNGIGTRDERRSIPVLGRIISSINMAFAPTRGDAARILREATRDFKDSYRRDRGDRIVLFGYSRGAALARKFASILLRDGLCDHVYFLGVFDTVAALNGIQRPGDDIATDVLFENGTLHRGIQRAVHILALDEDRTLFAPTLINKDEDRPERITEVWFPGVHGDVGGGYWHDGLSDVTLRFMIDQCIEHLQKWDISFATVEPEICRMLKKLKTEDELSGIHLDDVAMRPLTDGPLHGHSGPIVELGGRRPRKVRVNYNDQNSGDSPYVHESVQERFRNVTDYRPVALRGLKYKLVNDSANVYEDEVIGIAV